MLLSYKNLLKFNIALVQNCQYREIAHVPKRSLLHQIKLAIKNSANFQAKYKLTYFHINLP
jgi:hypothetical protein